MSFSLVLNEAQEASFDEAKACAILYFIIHRAIPNSPGINQVKKSFLIKVLYIKWFMPTALSSLSCYVIHCESIEESKPCLSEPAVTVCSWEL